MEERHDRNLPERVQENHTVPVLFPFRVSPGIVPQYFLYFIRLCLTGGFLLPKFTRL